MTEIFLSSTANFGNWRKMLEVELARPLREIIKNGEMDEAGVQ